MVEVDGLVCAKPVQGPADKIRRENQVFGHVNFLVSGSGGKCEGDSNGSGLSSRKPMLSNTIFSNGILLHMHLPKYTNKVNKQTMSGHLCTSFVSRD